MRYPMFVGPLPPSNPQSANFQAAIDALVKAEDKFYDNRIDVFNELDFGNFTHTRDEVEAKYENLFNSKLGPWEYQAEFESEAPSRKEGDTHLVPSPTPGGGFTEEPSYRFVKNSFAKSGISSGYVETIFPWTIKRYGSSASEEVLAYHFNRGKVSIDPLYGGLKAFKSAGSELSGYTYSAGLFTGPLQVWDGFGQVPEAWQGTANYNSRQLGVMKAAGDVYEDMVRGKINSYITALNAYNAEAGGDDDFDLIDDTFTGVGDRPWDGFVGSNVSYNRPNDLPRQFVREVRGI